MTISPPNQPTNLSTLTQDRAARTVKHSTTDDRELQQQQQKPSRVLRVKRPAAVADLAAAPAPPSKRLTTPQRHQQHQHQHQIIKTDVVTKEHYWVFDFGERTALYTLRCPSSTCSNPVFSKHPLREERAERHFKSCGVTFRDTADLVRRYARLGMCH